MLKYFKDTWVIVWAETFSFTIIMELTESLLILSKVLVVVTMVAWSTFGDCDAHSLSWQHDDLLGFRDAQTIMTSNEMSSSKY
jgi:hypothetical protein